MTKRDPINPTDDAARKLAQGLLGDARFGALAVTHPDTQTPYVARVAMIWNEGALFTLISTLSTHTKAVQKTPQCAALIGEPSAKGDPLTHQRMTVMAHAHPADKAAMKSRWLTAIPKAQLYYDFSDFLLFRLEVLRIDLNGGFGKAFQLTPKDLQS